MNNEILFLRHGKAANPVGVADIDRPLKPRGIRQACRIGAWLKDNDALPDVVLSSTAKRAHDTARHALVQAGLDPAAIRLDKRLYFDTDAHLTAAVAACDGAGKRLLVVGHNPWMEEWVLNLADTPPSHPGGNWYMKTGALMRFAVPDFSDGLKPGQGRLLDHVLPRHLEDDDL